MTRISPVSETLRSVFDDVERTFQAYCGTNKGISHVDVREGFERIRAALSGGLAQTAPQPTRPEIQSGMDRQRWAENLILQLPVEHHGRNSWLLNYGRGEFAKTL